jgi:hypothetical protein
MPAAKQRVMRLLLLFLLGLTLFLSPAAAVEVVDQAIEVSIVQLIANPEQYDGRLVVLTGFVHFAYEADAIYLHRDDYEWSIYRNGLSLGRGGEGAVHLDESDLTFLQNQYVRVVARFRANSNPRLDYDWSGTLVELRSIGRYGSTNL